MIISLKLIAKRLYLSLTLDGASMDVSLILMALTASRGNRIKFNSLLFIC
jgi:hypothetical protein